MIIIKLPNGKEHHMDDQEFRSILVTAAYAFSKIKLLEGAEFPRADKNALDAIISMQFKDSSLI